MALVFIGVTTEEYSCGLRLSEHCFSFSPLSGDAGLKNEDGAEGSDAALRGEAGLARRNGVIPLGTVQDPLARCTASLQRAARPFARSLTTPPTSIN